MTSALIIKITIWTIVAVTAAFTVYKISVGVKKAGELVDTIKKATDNAATVPMTISGAEGLMRQKVKRDFPGFDADYASEGEGT